MKEIYISYHCNNCGKTNILITDEIEDTLKKDKYLSCSHCGSKRIFEEKKTNDLRKCMKHDSYKRKHGALRQVMHE
ncbi:hypothetical protein [Clostridium sp. CH2]|uniref:hypothetical protein n=1 Tax=Clostridium sp. CH2 TaxID=2949990 RepID=UPI00207957E4|nr:hypothetical protein [Clostridium sp. CH2]